MKLFLLSYFTIIVFILLLTDYCNKAVENFILIMRFLYKNIYCLCMDIFDGDSGSWEWYLMNVMWNPPPVNNVCARLRD